MKKPSLRAILRTIHNYVVFFLVVAFAVTCCMLLFVNTLADTQQREIDFSSASFVRGTAIILIIPHPAARGVFDC